jgi:hypothetical protein
MRTRFTQVLLFTVMTLFGTKPVAAQPLNLQDGKYNITLYGCMNAGSTCEGSLTVNGGILTGVFLPFGAGNGSLGSVNQIQTSTTQSMSFGISGGDLFWGAIGYYQGPYTFLPPETLTWGAFGLTTESFEIQGPVTSINLETGAVTYGPGGTIYAEVATGGGGWATITRTGDVPTPPPSNPVYYADIRSLVLPSILDTQTGGPLAIPELQSISPSLLSTIANVIRADKQTIEVPVRFADPVSIPEPSTVALLSVGLVGLVGARRRRS